MPQLGASETLLAYLKHLECNKVIRVGAADRLYRDSRGNGSPSAAAAFGELEDYLASPSGEVLVMNPDRPEPASKDAVRNFITRLKGFMINAEHADELATRWSLDFAGMTPGQLAKAIVSRLGWPENAMYLADKPPVGYGERKLAAILAEMQECGYVSDRVDVASLAARWRGLGSMSTQQIVSVVASRLKDESTAAELCPGGTPPSFDYGAPPFVSQPLGDEARSVARDAGYDI